MQFKVAHTSNGVQYSDLETLQCTSSDALKI